MSFVVCGVHPSVHAAHQASAEEIGFSVTSVYNKVNGIKPSINGELVREVAGQMEATIRHLNATIPDWLPGYRVKIIDGNAFPEGVVVRVASPIGEDKKQLIFAIDRTQWKFLGIAKICRSLARITAITPPT